MTDIIEQPIAETPNGTAFGTAGANFPPKPVEPHQVHDGFVRAPTKKVVDPHSDQPHVASGQSWDVAE